MEEKIREYTDEELEYIAEQVIDEVKENIRERVREEQFELIDMDYEIQRALDFITDYGRAPNWKWRTEADKDKLYNELLDTQAVADRVYEEIENEKE